MVQAELAPEATKKTYGHPCVIAQTLDILGDRWTFLILRDLMSGLNRFNDILENCAGMSPNVLSDRLKKLEQEGLVTRTRIKELPPRVDYSLSEKGWAVRPILLSMIEWGRQYLEPFGPESVGTKVSTDFAVRVIPAFSFNPSAAEGIDAVMAIEISDCAGCNTWSFEIREAASIPIAVRSATRTSGW
jgi:DNA-binding HxlR family transcriptional regulator